MIFSIYFFFLLPSPYLLLSLGSQIKSGMNIIRTYKRILTSPAVKSKVIHHPSACVIIHPIYPMMLIKAIKMLIIFVIRQIIEYKQRFSLSIYNGIKVIQLKRSYDCVIFLTYFFFLLGNPTSVIEVLFRNQIKNKKPKSMISINPPRNMILITDIS